MVRLLESLKIFGITQRMGKESESSIDLVTRYFRIMRNCSSVIGGKYLDPRQFNTLPGERPDQKVK
jgi:hypothetical protein